MTPSRVRVLAGRSSTITVLDENLHACTESDSVLSTNQNAFPINATVITVNGGIVNAFRLVDDTESDSV